MLRKELLELALWLQDSNLRKNEEAMRAILVKAGCRNYLK